MQAHVLLSIEGQGTDRKRGDSQTVEGQVTIWDTHTLLRAEEKHVRISKCVSGPNQLREEQLRTWKDIEPAMFTHFEFLSSEG